MAHFDDLLQRFTPEALGALRRPELNELNFNEAVELLEAIGRLLQALNLENIADLPEGRLDEARGQAARALEVADEITNFTAAQDGAFTQRTSIIDRLRSYRNEFVERFRPMVRGQEVDLNAAVSDATSIGERLRAADAESQSILLQLRRSAGDAVELTRDLGHGLV